MYYLHLDDFYIVGASPELLVRVEDGVVSNHPIAGTRPRSPDSTKDKALEEELRNDEKECAEHLMLVDLARNDVGRISEPGTVEVTQFMDIERYSHVMHLVSHVQGKLRDGLTQFDAMRACFPAGTVSGAPKIRAMEIIAELEPDKRGPYAGAVVYFDFSGNMDTAIAIRTIVIKDGVAYVQAGGGVVADSAAYDWRNDAPPTREEREVVYEMHVAGFTRHPASGVPDDRRGTYAGVADKIPHLLDLGVTAVELLPVPPLTRDQVRLLGSIGHFQTINHRDIEVFAGLWNGIGPLRHDPIEISRILEIPLRDLVQTHIERGFHDRIPDIQELRYPFEDVEVWGATARILHHFIELMYPILAR